MWLKKIKKGLDKSPIPWYNKDNPREREVKEMKKTLERTIGIITVAWLVWFAASWLEICLFNTSGDPQYSAWNLFEILIN